jgi:hypothetical protein
MVTLNSVHREQLGQSCQAHGIEVIPLDVILTTSNIQTIPPTVEQLTEAMRIFSIRFIVLIQSQLRDFHCRRPDPKDLRDFI